MMLTKEYRVPLPLSVDEYRIAQLYMIQKKSREESQGAGSGVEILVNEPYVDGPGGDGQYTYKIYHIGSHLPGWFRAILPKSALQVEEEAWNAYPYTKTRYRCPFIEKFLLEIETRYLPDGGQTDNVFNLSSSELRLRTVDIIDMVKDNVSSGDYRKEEDPHLFRSHKTGRGPLNDNWRQEYIVDTVKRDSDKKLMCAYKLCKVEFRYWGMQSKIERFIHDIGLRKTMLRAHRQAWCWQDEWFGLQLSDIRRLEKETQLALAQTMGEAYEDKESRPNVSGDSAFETNEAKTLECLNKDAQGCHDAAAGSYIQNGHSPAELSRSERQLSRSERQLSRSESNTSGNHQLSTVSVSRKTSWNSNRGSSKRHSGSIRSPGWQTKSLVENLHDSMSESEDEFYDAQEIIEENPPPSPRLLKTSSNEMLVNNENEFHDADDERCQSLPLNPSDFPGQLRNVMEFQRLSQITQSVPSQQTHDAQHRPKTSILFIVLHGGSILESSCDLHSQQSDIGNLQRTFESVLRSHYSHMYSEVAIRLVKCPYVCCETLGVLSSLCPFSFDTGKSPDSLTPQITSDYIPLGAISLFATMSPDYYEQVSLVITRVNHVFQEFLQSEEGQGFNGQVGMIGDSVGGIIGYDSLCRSQNPSGSQESSTQGSRENLADFNQATISSQCLPTTPHLLNNNNVKSNLKTNASRNSSDGDHSPEPDNVNATDNPQSGITRKKSEVSFSEYDIVIETTEDNEHGEQLKTLPSPTSYDKPNRTTSTSSNTTTDTNDSGSVIRLDFDVSDFFTFGSPLALVLAFRRMNLQEDQSNPPSRPPCSQVYNLFHPTDPSACRLEPLIDDRFKGVPPLKVPRYQKYPLGNGQSLHIVECIQTHKDVLASYNPLSLVCTTPTCMSTFERRDSAASNASGAMGDLAINNMAYVLNRWWGGKRLDYALYCPEALTSFPTNSLPQLFHGSYWESTDVVAFILRQVMRQSGQEEVDGETNISPGFTPNSPREKWIHKRTAIKCRNISPNHRGNDVVVLEDSPQVLSAKFMYGPLDMVSLNRERVDIHIMTSTPSGEWVYYDTEMTDNNGRLTYTLPIDKRLSQGMYPVKMVVRGDHTCADFYLTVLPPKTECAVFSIDGSFTASVSIMGKDPKVRPGAVDVVRHWQELGYMIVYISARPDMQAKRVTAWLAQHNFPYGMVAFMELKSDPLKQKTNHLKTLINEAQIEIKAAYGSSKDIHVYQNAGIKPNNMYIVGKLSRSAKQSTLSSQIVHISDGYAAHLEMLSVHQTRPAMGNARMLIRKSCFGLPCNRTKSQHKLLTKSMSLTGGTLSDKAEDNSSGIVIGRSGNTVVKAGQIGAGKAVQSRGKSPRAKVQQP